MTPREALETASAAVGVVTLLFIIVGGTRRMMGTNQLRRRYQARAHRSVVLSELWPDPWADRPYGTFRPEDIGA